MTGSPDQVRQESYKQRVANIRTLVRQLTVTQKELVDGVSKDAVPARYLHGVLDPAGRACLQSTRPVLLGGPAGLSRFRS